MKVRVWDTYVTRSDGNVMHFDIIAPENENNEEVIYGYGKAYLATKNQELQSLTASECKFCHVEEGSPEIVASINAKGYYILEMQNCTI